MICSVDDCNNSGKITKTFCSKHYKRYARHGSPYGLTRTPPNNNTKNPLYRTWGKMIDRCNNPNYPMFKNYGGRGIKVCDRWSGINGFIHFYEDMGDKPTLQHSIDRIDNDAGYYPENCRWATQQMQGVNRRMFSTNTSGVTGVYYYAKYDKWCAQITVTLKTIHLGYFKTKQEAVKARKEGEAKYHKPLLG